MGVKGWFFLSNRYMYRKIEAKNNWRPPGYDRQVDLMKALEFYSLKARAEGKSRKTIESVTTSVRGLERYLRANGISMEVEEIDTIAIYGYLASLNERNCFSNHPFTPEQPRKLSGHTKNAYARGLSVFFGLLYLEGLINTNPFDKVRIPKAPKKIIPAFTDDQLMAIYGAIDTNNPLGGRDYTCVTLLHDTGIRAGGLVGLCMEDVDFDRQLISVTEKGQKERQVPIGKRCTKALWKYIHRYRPEPATPWVNNVFLTKNGRPLTTNRLGKIVRNHCTKAGITGVRLSTHTFRHTFAISYIRNGGDVFTLRQVMGHSRLETLMVYVNMASTDVTKAHRRCSPADNLDFQTGGSL
jgi:site-specific recombinase XerD